MIRSVFLATAVLLYTLLLGIPACVIVWVWPGTVVKMSYLYFRLIMAAAIGIKVEVTGRENISPGQNYVFLSNHQSAFDIPVLYLNLPFHIRFLAKKELGRIPIFGWVMRALGHVIIDRENIQKAKASIDRASERIRREHLSIIAFPEGTRTRDGEVRRFKKGVFFLAMQAKTPVVPVSIQGAYEIFPKGRWTYRPGTIRMHIHSPVETAPFGSDNKDELVENVRSLVAAGMRKPVNKEAAESPVAGRT